MKKILLFLFVILSSTLIAQQVENGSFENWETENGKDEPVDWSSIQTGLPAAISNLAPQVVFQSTDAHSGSYSIKLENKSTFGIVANGIVTNGRVMADLDPTKAYIFTDINDNRWNTQITGKPDSLVGWFKYAPSAGDTGSALAILHIGEAQAPSTDSSNFVAEAKISFGSTVSNWTRFSVPFNYYNTTDPEYVLFILTSGNGTNAVDGSIGYFDDIELIYNAVSVKEINVLEGITAYGGNQKITIDTRDITANQMLNVRIYDIVGNEILNDHWVSGSSKEIDQIKSGVYICQVIINNSVYTQKIAVR